MIENIQQDIQPNLRKYNQKLVDMKAQERLSWGYKQFDNQFAILIPIALIAIPLFLSLFFSVAILIS